MEIPNQDSRGCRYTFYTMWITGGLHVSGANCQKEIWWPNPGIYNISVRATDNIFNPNRMSDWSENLTVNVTSSVRGFQSWNKNFLREFISTLLGVE